MNVKALVLAAASAGVAVVTLVALNLIAPITHAAEGHAEGVTAEQVFSASIDAPGASAPAPAAMQVAAAETSSAPPATPMEVAQAETSEPAADASASSEPPSAPASESAAPATSGGACSTGIVDPNQKPVVVMASGLPGESSAPAMAEAATAAAPEAAPAAEPAPVAAAGPASSMAEPAPAPEAAPKPKAKPKPKAPKVAPPEAKVAWWPAKTAGKLNLTYAGEASFTKAIVLLFDGAFDTADSVNQNVKVTTKSGQPVAGKWLVATGNKQMLLFNVGPGLYKVSVGSGVTDKGNRPISAESSGFVFIP